jgi:hypothetical protein
MRLGREIPGSTAWNSPEREKTGQWLAGLLCQAYPISALELLKSVQDVPGGSFVLATPWV